MSHDFCETRPIHCEPGLFGCHLMLLRTMSCGDFGEQWDGSRFRLGGQVETFSAPLHRLDPPRPLKRQARFSPFSDFPVALTDNHRMPVIVRAKRGNEAGKPWKIVERAGGRVVGQSDTKGAASASARIRNAHHVAKRQRMKRRRRRGS